MTNLDNTINTCTVTVFSDQILFAVTIAWHYGNPWTYRAPNAADVSTSGRRFWILSLFTTNLTKTKDGLRGIQEILPPKHVKNYRALCWPELAKHRRMTSSHAQKSSITTKTQWMRGDGGLKHDWAIHVISFESNNSNQRQNALRIICFVKYLHKTWSEKWKCIRTAGYARRQQVYTASGMG